MDIVTDIQELRKVCKVVPVPSEEEGPDKLVELYDLLHSEMVAHNGQGLAANQLGIQQQMFVMRWEGMAPICLVNPVITKETKARKAKEGCLSLLGVFVEVTRPLIIKVKGFNQYFKPVTYKFRGIDARRACHEIDHLNGKLIIDYEED